MIKETQMRVSDVQARAIRTYKSVSENEPGQEARDLAADLEGVRAAAAMIVSHGMHGPCLHNGCADYLHAYNKSLAALSRPTVKEICK